MWSWQPGEGYAVERMRRWRPVDAGDGYGWRPVDAGEGYDVERW
jgi:hypothetical protein